MSGMATAGWEEENEENGEEGCEVLEKGRNGAVELWLRKSRRGRLRQCCTESGDKEKGKGREGRRGTSECSLPRCCLLRIRLQKSREKSSVRLTSAVHKCA